MKEERSSSAQSLSDSEFDDLLGSAKVNMPLPGSFQAEVWGRISSVQEASLLERMRRFFDAFLVALPNPVTASALVLSMIAAGLWLGSWGRNPEADGKIAYVQSVSPFANSHRTHQR